MKIFAASLALGCSLLAPAAFADADSIDPTLMIRLRQAPRAQSGVVCTTGSNVGFARDAFNGALQLPHLVTGTWMGSGNRLNRSERAVWPPYDASSVSVTIEGRTVWMCGVLTSRAPLPATMPQGLKDNLVKGLPGMNAPSAPGGLSVPQPPPRPTVPPNR